MYILLGSANELLVSGIKVKGEKQIPVPEQIYYFFEIQEDQITLSRCKMEDNSATKKGSFQYAGIDFHPLDQSYFGKLSHAINHYLHIRLAHTEEEGAWAAVEEIKRLLESIPSSLKTTAKLLEEVPDGPESEEPLATSERPAQIESVL
jgi:hypothetical protein